MLSNTLKTTEICLWLTVLLCVLLVFAVSFTSSYSVVNSAQKTNAPCSSEWYQYTERKVATGNGHGHSPDIGSDECMSVIEFNLGIIGKSTVPQRDSDTAL